MNPFASLFSCCIPGRRRSANVHSDTESTPLLHAPSSSRDLYPFPKTDPQRPFSSAGVGTTATPSRLDDRGSAKPGTGTTGSPSAASAPSNLPSYTTEDLALITGWATSRFISVKNPTAPLMEEVQISKAQTDSALQHVAADEQLQALIVKLARGVSFDLWSEDREGNPGARSDQASDDDRNV